jgi:hypothetical protein
MTSETTKKAETDKVQQDLVATDAQFVLAAERVRQRFEDVRGGFKAGDISETQAKTMMSTLRTVLKKLHLGRRQFLVAHHALVERATKNDLILEYGYDCPSGLPPASQTVQA